MDSRIMLLKRAFSAIIKGNVSCLGLIYGLCIQIFILSDVFCSADLSNPRLTLTQEDDRLLYNTKYRHTVLFRQEGSSSLFVGGINVVLQVDVDSGQILKNFTLNPNLPKLCGGTCCENVVTVIQHFQNSTLVCGTNGETPKCWKLYPEEYNHSMEVTDGIGISPHTCSQNSISLVAEPTFISSFLAKRKDDPINEKIYVFFREKNSDTSPEADPWISRVARVCKVDEGGPKQILQNIWTSFLKARLVCGIPRESLYFNRLQDVFVLHTEDWRDSRVYALFSSSWNSTAVCIYSLAELDGVFETSPFKGFKKEIPSPRPGTCVKNSNSIPIAALNVIKDHPEMKDWIQPLHKDTPFFTSNNNYTKIVVDRVEASNGSMHNVLLLATDNGVILKILEDDSKAFIISETHLCNDSAPIQAMILDSEKEAVCRISCSDVCVRPTEMSGLRHFLPGLCSFRDPYCAWTEHGCTSQAEGGIQNIADGKTHVCDGKPKGRFKRDLSIPSLRIRHSVPLEVPFYLSCPISSHHATYWWESGDKRNTCQQTQSECLLLIPAMTNNDYGNYTCKSEERDYTKIVKEYFLSKPVFNNAFKLPAQGWIKATFVTVALYLYGI